MKLRRAKPVREEGFALLMVFVMAAAVAITLYMEIPRVAFESQRVKEQLLVDRGNQYKRAIQVFYRKNKRYPQSIDELESYQSMRFLRHRYKDPFTGKEEWRLVHVGPNGMLTDSVIKQTNPLAGGQQGQTAQNGTPGQSAQPGFGQFGSGQPGQNGQPDPNNPNGQPDPVTGLNMAVARRPSDRTGLGTAGGPGAVPSQDPNNPNYADPNGQNPQNPTPVAYPGQSPAPGQASYPGQPQVPGQTPAGVQPYPGQVTGQVPAQQGPFPNQAPFPGQQYPGQQYPGQPAGVPLPSTGGSNAAVSAIQQQLFGPRPAPPGVGVPSGFPQNPSTPTQGGFGTGGSSFNSGNSSFNNGTSSFNNGTSTFNSGTSSFNNGTNGITSGSSLGTNQSGGIAGIATKYKGPSIMVVNKRKKYQEWEFVYDPSKDKSVVGNAANLQQQMQANQGTNPGLSSSFGNSSGIGSSFGSAGTGGTGSSFGQNATPTTPAPAQPPGQQQP